MKRSGTGRIFGALALAALLPACGSGDGGSPGEAVAVFLEDADGVLKLRAAAASGRTWTLSEGAALSFAWSPDRAWVAFVDDLRRLHLVAPSGGGLRQISPDGHAAHGGYRWTSEGSRLAFASSGIPDGVAELRSASTAGAVDLIARMASTTADALAFAWAPDGSRIAFAGDPGGVSGLHTARPDGTDRVLAAATGSKFLWTPDASRLAYFTAGETPKTYAYRTVSPLGGPSVQVTGPQSFAWAILASWSSAGRLVYGNFEDGFSGEEIYTVEGDGSDRVRVSPGAGQAADALNPRWAPGGARLLFQSRVGDGPYVVWICGPRGEDGVSIGSASDPAWSPEGSRLGFLAGGDLFVAGADGSGPLKLTPGSVAAFRWSPAGGRIAYIAAKELHCSRADGSAGVQVAGGDVAAFQWTSDGAALIFQNEAGELFHSTPDGAPPRRLSGGTGPFQAR